MEEEPETRAAEPVDPPKDLWLIVDDDDLVLSSLARFFRREGLVLTAGSRAQAEKLAADHPALSGIIVDIRLPDGSGLELLRSLRARGVRVPALVVTALTDLELVSQATAAGAMFAPKPFLLEHLEAFVDDVRAKRLPRTKLRAVVERLAAAHHLSDREEDLVFHAAAGLRELHLERRLGVRHTTLRGMFHNVIARTGDRTFADVITRVHAEVFAPEAPLPWHADRPRARSRA